MQPPNDMQNMQSNSISQICPINTKRAVYMLNFEKLFIPVGMKFKAQI